MPYLLAGLIIVIALLLAVRWFANASPQSVARGMRVVGGLACIGVAGLLMLRGLAIVAVPLGGFGLALLLGATRSWIGAQPKSSGQMSRVVTDHLEMELDHDTGQMQGRVLKGQFFGRKIADMTPAELAMLWQDCRFADPQSAELIAVYLDTTHPTWRDDVSAARGEGASDNAEQAASQAHGTMTLDEAYDILGLDETATADDVRRVHRMLIQKVHPDHGGSTYLASKINAAKELLLAKLSGRLH